MNCPVCDGHSSFFTQTRIAGYHRCSSCGSVFMDAGDMLAPEQDAIRYTLHRNDPADPDYRAFVSPLVESVAARFPAGSVGLDYGSGDGSAVSAMLEEAGMRMSRYDPYVTGGQHSTDKPRWLSSDDLVKARGLFDFVVCCEVAEHFRDPLAEFAWMRSLAKPGGILAVMTQLYRDGIDFASWHYAKDETHKVFYTEAGMRELAKRAGFASVAIEGNIVLLS